MIIKYSEALTSQRIFDYQLHHPGYLNRRSKDQKGQGMVITYTHLSIALTTELVLALVLYLYLPLFLIMEDVLAINWVF